MPKTPSNIELETAKNRFVDKFNRCPPSKNNCILWNGKPHHGYGRFGFNLENDGSPPKERERQISAHRAAYFFFNGPLDEEEVIRHSCDNPICVNPSHLIKGTHKENVLDRVERNRSAYGSKNGRAKLDKEKVVEIKEMLLSDTSIVEIARNFGVDPKAIRQIKENKTWVK
jgi:hypothetical protein